jgi:dipeptidase E
VRVYLASGGVRTSEQIEAFCNRMRELLGERRSVLVIPYASGGDPGSGPPALLRVLGEEYRFGTIDSHSDRSAAIESAEAIFVPGGNTFRLLHALYQHDLIEPLRRSVRDRGTPYLGASAGANIACPTIQTTNDMPIVLPSTLDALGLVPFQINPHYFPGRVFFQWNGGYEPHNGETRDDRIAQFHQLNDRPVVGLWEGSLLRCEDDEVWLEDGPARLFRRGERPVDLAPSARIDSLW